MTNLFEAAGLGDTVPRPLADTLRPQRLEDVVGQDHLLSPEAPIGRMVKQGRLSSIILWGPPGTGKTTIARLLAGIGGLFFEQISAVFSGVADLRKVFDAAKQRRQTGQGTLLFVDEIHRFNRAQQDSFLPYVEDGTVILVGATTENPSFELNAALLSRTQVLVLKRLEDVGLECLIERAEEHLGKCLPLAEEARASLRAMADGDGRYLFNLIEEIYAVDEGELLTTKDLAEIVQRRAPLYDKSSDEHYNLISALHKSIRGSDVDAALYWLSRMLLAGEDPLYISRRLVRAAVEDIGLADPHAVVQAIAARDAYEFLGSPEGELALGQAVVYLAAAPKSNAVYKAFAGSRKAAMDNGSLMPPKHSLNAPTRLMRDLGYSEGYKYDHNAPESFSGQNFFPEGMVRLQFYRPTNFGEESKIGARLGELAKLRKSVETKTTKND